MTEDNVALEAERNVLRGALERLMTWIESTSEFECLCEVGLENECVFCEACRVLGKPKWTNKAPPPTAREIRDRRTMRHTLFGNMKEALAADGVDAGVLDVVLKTMDEEDEAALKLKSVDDGEEEK